MNFNIYLNSTLLKKTAENTFSSNVNEAFTKAEHVPGYKKS